jgi:hypothetical protein
VANRVRSIAVLALIKIQVNQLLDNRFASLAVAPTEVGTQNIIKIIKSLGEIGIVSGSEHLRSQ